MIYQKILKTIQKEGYFTDHDKVLIAVSGGVDSMNLLHFLHQHQQDLAISIGIAHVNHKQRIQSDEEEAYLRMWADQHQLPFFVTDFTGKFSEKAARSFRYSFFNQVMQKEGYTALVTAHHADDQAETIFMRLLRGSRLRHLAGMKIIQNFGPGQLIRPFLNVKKSDLPRVFHFEDETNAGENYLRNRIRNIYLPNLARENPNLSTALRELGQETTYLLTALSDLSSELEATDLQTFQQKTTAVQYYLLQDYLSQFTDLELSRRQFTALLDRLRENKQEEDSYLKSGYYLHLRKEQFWLDKIGPETDSTFARKVLEYGKIVSIGQNSFEFNQTGEVPLTSLKPIILRPRQSGDRIDFGDFHKKLRRLFIDEKIPSKERNKAIVGEQDGILLFVLVNGHLYLRKVPQCVTIKAKLCIKTKEIGDL